MHLSLSHYFQVQDILKEKPYKVDLADYFQDVNSLLAITFQITIHNWRKSAKVVREELLVSKHHGKAKLSSLHQGDGTQGASTAEILKKKKGELEERRRKKRDKMVCALLLFCNLPT